MLWILPTRKMASSLPLAPEGSNPAAPLDLTMPARASHQITPEQHHIVRFVRRNALQYTDGQPGRIAAARLPRSRLKGCQQRSSGILTRACVSLHFRSSERCLRFCVSRRCAIALPLPEHWKRSHSLSDIFHRQLARRAGLIYPAVPAGDRRTVSALTQLTGTRFSFERNCP